VWQYERALVEEQKKKQYRLPAPSEREKSREREQAAAAASSVVDEKKRAENQALADMRKKRDAKRQKDQEAKKRRTDDEEMEEGEEEESAEEGEEEESDDDRRDSDYEEEKPQATKPTKKAAAADKDKDKDKDKEKTPFDDEDETPIFKESRKMADRRGDRERDAFFDDDDKARSERSERSRDRRLKGDKKRDKDEDVQVRGLTPELMSSVVLTQSDLAYYEKHPRLDEISKGYFVLLPAADETPACYKLGCIEKVVYVDKASCDEWRLMGDTGDDPPNHQNERTSHDDVPVFRIRLGRGSRGYRWVLKDDMAARKTHLKEDLRNAQGSSKQPDFYYAQRKIEKGKREAMRSAQPGIAEHEKALAEWETKDAAVEDKDVKNHEVWEMVIEDYVRREGAADLKYEGRFVSDLKSKQEREGLQWTSQDVNTKIQLEKKSKGLQVVRQIELMQKKNNIRKQLDRLQKRIESSPAEQRETLLRQRDAKKEELEALEKQSGGPARQAAVVDRPRRPPTQLQPPKGLNNNNSITSGISGPRRAGSGVGVLRREATVLSGVSNSNLYARRECRPKVMWNIPGKQPSTEFTTSITTTSNGNQQANHNNQPPQPSSAPAAAAAAASAGGSWSAARGRVGGGEGGSGGGGLSVRLNGLEGFSLSGGGQVIDDEAEHDDQGMSAGGMGYGIMREHMGDWLRQSGVFQRQDFVDALQKLGIS